MGDFTAIINNEKKELKDGINEFGRIQIGIAYHFEDKPAQVTVKNSESVPGRFSREWLSEGESTEIAGISVTHNKSIER